MSDSPAFQLVISSVLGATAVFSVASHHDPHLLPMMAAPVVLASLLFRSTPLLTFAFPACFLTILMLGLLHADLRTAIAASLFISATTGLRDAAALKLGLRPYPEAPAYLRLSAGIWITAAVLAFPLHQYTPDTTSELYFAFALDPRDPYVSVSWAVTTLVVCVSLAILAGTAMPAGRTTMRFLVTRSRDKCRC